MSDSIEILLAGEKFTQAFPSLIRALKGDVLSAVVLQAINFRSHITKPDTNDEVWVDLRIYEIADEIGISTSQAQRALVKLRSLGLLMERQNEEYENKKMWRVDVEGVRDLALDANSKLVRNRSKVDANSNQPSCEIAVSTYIEEDIRTNKNFSEQCLNACNLLADLIADNGSKRPTVTQGWITDMDKLNRIDQRTWQEIEHIINWSQNDSFWRTNILSPGKLRKQFDQLRLKAQPAKSGTLLWAELAAQLDTMEGKELEQ